MLKSTSFVFDGIPSENYGVMIYFLDDSDKRELDLGTNVEIIEDRLAKRTSPIHYGVNLNQSMSFPLTFGSTEYLSDYDVDAILSWLTGHNQYKWLEYVDGDHYVRYKCHLNNMKSIYINGLSVAFTCDVVCDGQFAYEYSSKYKYDVNESELKVNFLNKSSYNGYIYPTLQIQMEDDCSDLTIINDSDNGREFHIGPIQRTIVETTSEIKEIYTSINEEFIKSKDGESTNIISWKSKSTDIDGNYNKCICGSESWVMLPTRGNVALYSFDEGVTWEQSILPYSGSWTGCYGEDKFVAICTDIDTAVATYSYTGEVWTTNPISMPHVQKWNHVSYFETQGFIPNLFIAIGNSSNYAISTDGLSWISKTQEGEKTTELQLPNSQSWKYVFGTKDKIISVGGDTDIAAVSTNCIDWEILQLPTFATWTSGCCGDYGYVIVADTLYQTASRKPIALFSKDGVNWEITNMPIGNWSKVIYYSGGYVAIGDRRFAISWDGKNWVNTNTNFDITTDIALFKKYTDDGVLGSEMLVCAMGTNTFMYSDNTSQIVGTFEIPIQLNQVSGDLYNMFNVKVYATVANTLNDTSYTSNGTVLLASHLLDKETGETTSTGGEEYIAVTTNRKFDYNVDGMTMMASYNPETKIVTVNYNADSESKDITAELTVRIEYQLNTSTNLGYDGLEIKIDNEDQTLSSNKDSLNMYQNFNMKFLRLIRGYNKLRFKTSGGSCKVIMSCDFLRKVGGR